VCWKSTVIRGSLRLLPLLEDAVLAENMSPLSSLATH
jgi:hypothetical protein